MTGDKSRSPDFKVEDVESVLALIESLLLWSSLLACAAALMLLDCLSSSAAAAVRGGGVGARGDEYHVQRMEQLRGVNSSQSSSSNGSIDDLPPPPSYQVLPRTPQPTRAVATAPPPPPPQTATVSSLRQSANHPCAQCRHCSVAAASPVVARRTAVMSNDVSDGRAKANDDAANGAVGGNMIYPGKTYGELGPPPKQPCNMTFKPKFNKIGRGSSQLRPGPSVDSPSSFFLANRGLLERHGVDPGGVRGPVRAGQVVLAAKPFVHVISTACRGKRCEGCLRKAPLKVVCSCQYAQYCSSACQESDRDNHGEECFYIKRRGVPPASDTARFLLRLLLKMRRGGERVADVVPGQSHPRRFVDLLDHHDDILRSGARLDMVNSYYADTIKTLGVEEAPDPEYFLQVYGRMAINSFHILDEFQDGIGVALYLGPSIMDHSCHPTAAVSFAGADIVVRSLVDVDDSAALDLASLRISYIELLECRRRRKDHLSKHYYFDCLCPGCDVSWFDDGSEDPERAMFTVRCGDCSAGEVFMGAAFCAEELKPEPCSHCGCRTSEYTADRYGATCEVVIERLEDANLGTDAIEFCFRIMNQSRFTTSHILYLKMTEAAFNSYLDEIEKLQKTVSILPPNTPDATDKVPFKRSQSEDVDALLETALFHGQNLLSGFSRFSCGRGETWRERGLYLLKVAELEFVLGSERTCRRHLAEARQVLLAACGGDSAHVKRAADLLDMLGEDEKDSQGEAES